MLAQRPENSRLWEAHGKSRPFAELGLDLQLAAVAPKNMLDDGKPEASAARRTRAPLVNAEKTLGKARYVLGSNADAGVPHAEDGAGAGASPGHMNRTALGRVANGVRNQVHCGASNLFGLPDERHVLDFNVYVVAAVRECAPFADDVFDKLGHGYHDRFVCTWFVAVLQPGKDEKIFK